MYRLTVLLAGLLTLVGHVRAQWVQTNGPDGGLVKLLTVNSSNGNFYAGTDGGVFRSSDGGATWQWTSTGLPAKASVTAMYISNSVSFVVDGSTGNLYRSNDGGTSWAPLSPTGLPTLPIFSYFVASGSALLAGVNGPVGGSGIYRSSDNGSSWTLSSTGLPASFYPGAMLVSGSNIFAGGHISSTSKGMYLSTNGGANWTAVNTNFPTTAGVTAMVAINATIFASTLNGGVFKTTDNGSNWTRINPVSPLTLLGAFSLAASPANLFIGAGVMFRADANGANADTTNTGLPPRNAGTAINALAMNGSNIVLSFAKLGIWRSTNSGTNWFKSSSGLRSLDMWGLYAEGSAVYASGIATGYFRSDNNGDTWTEANTNINLLNNGYYGFARSGSYLVGGSGIGPYRTTDHGNSWLTPSPDLPSVAYSFVVDGADLYASGQGYVAKSTNNGENWTLLNTGFLSSQAIFCLWKSGTIMLAGANTGGIKRSTDNGGTWTAPVSGLATIGAYSSMAQINTTYFIAHAGGVYRSSDDGASWSIANTGVSGAPQSLHARGGDLFVGTNQGIYRSTNLGTSWFAIGTGLPLTPTVYALTSNSQYLFAGLTANSVWRRPLSEVTDVWEVAANLPQAIALGQNYPNPFNPATTIRFSLPPGTNSRTSVRVYDLLGREIATLIDGTLRGGNYAVTFDGSRFASGVYVYRLQSGSMIETKRMLLVK